MRIFGWLAIIALGALVLSPAVAYFDFAKLPGDMTMTLGDTRFYAPITSSLLASGVLTLLFLIIRK